MKLSPSRIALCCVPLFLAGLFVSIRSHWRATELVFSVRSIGWRLTADEAGFYLTQYPTPKPWSAPLVPRTYDRSSRVRFSYVRSFTSSARMLHVPYWPFWMVVTPPILFWLHARSIQALRAARVRQRLCVECGYDLRATPHQCPECGSEFTKLS